MSTVVYTSGTWRPNAGSEDAFIAAWERFAGWASSMPGAGPLRLVRDISDPGRFVSFGDWDSIEAVRAWKGSPEFRERMARVLQHVDSFEPLELDLVATADGGSTRRAANGVHQVQRVPDREAAAASAWLAALSTTPRARCGGPRERRTLVRRRLLRLGGAGVSRRFHTVA